MHIEFVNSPERGRDVLLKRQEESDESDCPLPSARSQAVKRHWLVSLETRVELETSLLNILRRFQNNPSLASDFFEKTVVTTRKLVQQLAHQDFPPIVSALEFSENFGSVLLDDLGLLSQILVEVAIALEHLLNIL